MIADAAGVDCLITQENELGQYFERKEKVVYSMRYPNGTTFLRLKTGEQFFTNNKTAVVDGVK